MKAARPLPADLPSSRRAQPVRQTRNNPPRSSGLLARSFGPRDALGGGLGGGQSPEQRNKIYPAITYFADAITALPKELMRHMTLLKEVDAKIFAPEENLARLVDIALNSPLPTARPLEEPTQRPGPTSAAERASKMTNGYITSDLNGLIPPAIDAGAQFDARSSAWDPANIPRRQHFRQCAMAMQEMLVALDEKNHVISTATEALNRQLSRLDDCWPHLEQEISEEARYGSEKHWAYTDTRTSKPANEKSRKELAAQLSNGYPVSVDEAAARSELRKQAMLARKGRAYAVELDLEDHLDHRHRGELSKKPHGNSKKTRPADVLTNAGAGSANGAGINGLPPQAKRRKVEKGSSGSVAMERSISGVLGNNGAASKGKVNSPAGSPMPEASKKKAKSGTTINGHPRKRTAAANAMSPSLASSPIQSTFADSRTLGRTSPVPTNGGRPSTGRAGQNSTHSLVEGTRPPSTSTSNKPNGIIHGATDLAGAAGVTGRLIPEAKGSAKESTLDTKGERVTEGAGGEDPETRGGPAAGGKEGTLKREEAEVNGNSTPSTNATVVTTITTTKSGRASKPSTPAIPTFPEAVRSRSSRSALEQVGSNKRSHKKGAGQAAQLLAAQNADDETASKAQSDEEDVEIDADEPTYCYCNGVSYGEMVACDADGCAKEWFHLDCVGLKVAPKGNAKWYCDDCKEIMKNSKRFSGR